MMPMLNPAGAQEILDYGLYGWAMSRYAGCWVGAQVHEGHGGILGFVNDDPVAACRLSCPEDFVMPPGGLNIRWPDAVLEPGDAPAHVQAGLCRTGLHPGEQARPRHHLGGPQAEDRHHHHRQILSRRPPGLRRPRHRRGEGQRPRHPPLQDRPAPGRSSPEGCAPSPPASTSCIVVEEKRSLIEVQVREELYGACAHQPVVIGKKDEKGDWLCPSSGELDPNDVAIVHRRSALLKHVGHIEERSAR
jgi:indolepyruvate ferredoxin oxidoreductase